MKKQVGIFFLIVAATIGFGCQSAASQQNANSVSQDDKDDFQKTLIEIKTNDKYGLSLLFYEFTYNEKLHIEGTVRDDKTRIEKPVFIIEAELFPAESRDLWSPNEEYLATIESQQKIDVYKANDLSKFFRTAYAKKSDVTKLKTKIFENIQLTTIKDTEVFLHRFEKWQNNESVSFDVIRKGKKEEFIPPKILKYKYDIVSKKLFRLCPKNKDNSNDEKCLHDDIGMVGFRGTAESIEKGWIYPAGIKIEYY